MFKSSDKKFSEYIANEQKCERAIKNFRFVRNLSYFGALLSIIVMCLSLYQIPDYRSAIIFLFATMIQFTAAVGADLHIKTLLLAQHLQNKQK